MHGFPFRAGKGGIIDSISISTSGGWLGTHFLKKK
jgi:hypothetical protein